MRVTVTGVTGFVGGRVARRLAEAGHTVRGVARDPARWKDRPGGSEVVVGDLVDAAVPAAAAEGADLVVHAAALVKAWVKDRSLFDRVNIEAMERIARATAEAGGKLIYVSSFFALGPTDGATFDEDTPRATDRPHNDYERSKWQADRRAREMAADGVPIVSVYPGVVFGPGALTDGNHVVKLLLQHAHGKLPGMLGSGDLRQCFAYVDDVVDGIVRATAAQPGGRYILGGENRTALDLFAAFQRATGVAPPRRRIPFGVASWIGRLQRWRAELFGVEPELTEEVVEIYKHEWAYSSARAERELGYRITPFDDAIGQTVAWLRRTGELPAA